MTEHKEGERVLVEAIFKEYITDGILELAYRPFLQPLRREVHPHPGVPVASLLEELRLASELLAGRILPDEDATNNNVHCYMHLRAAREAAQKPKVEIDIRRRSPDEVDAFVKGMEYAVRHKLGDEAVTMARSVSDDIRKDD